MTDIIIKQETLDNALTCLEERISQLSLESMRCSGFVNASSTRGFLTALGKLGLLTGEQIRQYDEQITTAYSKCEQLSNHREKKNARTVAKNYETIELKD